MYTQHARCYFKFPWLVFRNTSREIEAARAFLEPTVVSESFFSNASILDVESKLNSCLLRFPLGLEFHIR